MSTIDEIKKWIFDIFKNDPKKSSDINKLVIIILETFTEEQFNDINQKILAIENLSDNIFSSKQIIAIGSIIKELIYILIPFFKKLKNVISVDNVNHVKENLNTFIQVLVLISLYKNKDEINISEIKKCLQIFSDIASLTIKIKHLTRFVRFKITLLKFFGCMS